LPLKENRAFLTISGPWIGQNMSVSGASMYPKALNYFRSLKASKRCNFRPRKSSISALFWNLRLNFTKTNVFQDRLM
jgi:hypothetical protein